MNLISTSLSGFIRKLCMKDKSSCLQISYIRWKIDARSSWNCLDKLMRLPSLLRVHFHFGQLTVGEWVEFGKQCWDELFLVFEWFLVVNEIWKQQHSVDSHLLKYIDHQLWNAILEAEVLRIRDKHFEKGVILLSWFRIRVFCFRLPVDWGWTERMILVYSNKVQSRNWRYTLGSFWGWSSSLYFIRGRRDCSNR